VSVLLEICVDTIEGCLAAQAGGARRIELCAGLIEGGTTPSAGMLQSALRSGLETVVLIRPRAGDFVYAAEEAEVMLRDVAFAKAAGAHGVALGALTAEGDVHAELVAVLAAAARPMQVCFHRAFDAARDLDAALAVLLGLGIDRVLTSGGAASAETGAPRIAALVAAAAGRLAVMPGGGVRPDNLAALLAATGAREVHSSARASRPSAMRHVNPELRLASAPTADGELPFTDPRLVRALARIAAGAEEGEG
jgi:copper homeostasis protein